jgi:fermentation-respiration switch protein FrsA (DUF1100 family)
VGYGLSTGKASESGCYATATAAYDYLTRTRRVPARKLIVVGGSLGGAVAIDLAARKPVAALAAFNTFTSMTAMASRMMPWAPSWLLLRHRFESARKIRRVQTPIFLAAGEADTFIPPSMSASLAAAAGGPVTQMQVREAAHGSLPTNGTPEFDAAFQAFLERVRRSPRFPSGKENETPGLKIHPENSISFSKGEAGMRFPRQPPAQENCASAAKRGENLAQRCLIG